MHLMLAEKHDICRVLYKWKTLLPLHYGKVSMGGVTFRISNCLPTLQENITFTFYLMISTSNSPCKSYENGQNPYFSDFECNFRLLGRFFHKCSKNKYHRFHPKKMFWRNLWYLLFEHLWKTPPNRRKLHSKSEKYGFYSFS